MAIHFDAWLVVQNVDERRGETSPSAGLAPSTVARATVAVPPSGATHASAESHI